MRYPQRILDAIPAGGFLRATLAIVAGTGIGQMLVILTSPVLTRLKTPSDYGVYSAATSILILVSVTCLRYEFAIPLPEDDVAAANLLGLSLLVNLGMCAVTAVLLTVFGPWLLSLFGASALRPYILLLVLAQFAGGVVSVFTNWAVRTKAFKEIGLNRLAQSAGLVVTQIGLGIAKLGATGLVIGTVTGALAGSERLVNAAWRTHAAAFRQISGAGMLTAARRYRRFPIFSSWSALLGALGLRAPLLVLIACYGTSVGGQYALAERIMYLPLTLVAGAVGQVFIADSARLARGQPAELRRLFRQTTWSLARVAIGPAILIAVATPFLVGPIFGENWHDAGVFVAVLVPLFYAAFVLTSTGDILYVVERQGLQLVREILRLGLLGGSVILAAALHLSAIGAVMLLSAAGCLMYVAYGLISWLALARFDPESGKKPEAIAFATELSEVEL
jgi:O-antigen/teichoic acid export membrane protein